MRHAITQYSVQLGNDRLLVQSAGGNISWKDGDTMWIKASGAQMRDAEARDIFVPVVLSKARDIDQPVEVDRRHPSSGLRPSIETTLHALMSQTVVVHVHSVQLLSKLVLRSREAALRSLLERPDHALVSYCKPGVDLARAVRQALESKPDATVLLLANHGVVIGGESVETVDRSLQDLLHSVHTPHRAQTGPWMPSPAPIGFRLPRYSILHTLAFDPIAYDILNRAWAITPDHVVFLGSDPCAYESLSDFETRMRPDQGFAIVKDHGVFINEAGSSNGTTTEEMLQCFLDIASRVDNAQSVEQLRWEDVTELLGWEAEKYRKSLAAKSIAS